MPPNLSSDDVKRPVERATDHPWFERLARFGYVAKGVVYFVVGLLAAQVALGIGGRTTDSQGALQTIVTQPFGQILLALVAVGMIGYALWRFTEALLDPEHSGEENSAKKIAQRLGYAISGLIYSGLAITAIQLIAGSSNSGGNSNSTQDWTARVLAQPFGQWLVGLAGIAVIGSGIYQIYKALKGKFRGELKWQQMSSKEKTWMTRAGKFGITARGIVFGIIGIFLIQAALQSDASEVKGFGEALATIAQQPFGRWLLGIVAFGLIAFSIYSVMQGKYRRIPTS
ncbi:MAG: DUF1206 domain-containing protein [Elainellaceae cyanobacterium]